ncbi:glycosyltransferase [Thauera humireducens]|uniref:Glycosyltransferase 2-like domain-containing protein n=1 Tax=Thauera humireducens TaxID=1134435 RepID=A0A140ID79_9RHOO|nr:glycosyltransferase [Thauera humireducens]AMO35704.1 hypothetical protein AC731_001315 [Thauera humireducens]
MNQTEIVNPPHPGKLELIEQVASRIAGPWRFIDLGGLWAVHGVYAFHALAQRGCLGGTEVDTHPTANFLSALANEPRLTYVQGNFGDAEVFAQLPPFDVVFLFDTLLHQVRPDWHEILSMYAARASHILIFNQQYTGEHTVRLLDLGEDAYFSNVPHDRAHPTYADLFRKLDQKHPAHDRNWRDVHHIWQWGITDDDLIATMATLGFEPVFSHNWGQVLDLARFENHAFIFSRVAPQAIAPAETASSAAASSTNATLQTDASILLPDPFSTLAAIDDDGTLTAKSAGEQLRRLRGYRRMLRPGGTLRVEAVDDETRAQLVDRARYAGFVDAAPRSGALTLRTPDHRLGAGEVPLVTVAIPAFKPAHFSACLESALAQTYPRLHILVCDDSGGDLLRRIADCHRADDRIEWVTNPVNIGGRANFIQCLERARGDFIKFLCDDDLLEPDCVEHMVAAFRRAPEAALVFSRRQRIDGDGAPLPDDHHTEALAEHDCVFRGEALAGAVIALQSNFIGEPTTVMFRRTDLAWIRPHYASFDGHDDIRVVGDIATWHNLLSQGEAVYLTRPLSRFRIHPGQNQARPEIRELIAESWAKVERGSRSLGFVQDPHPPVPHREPGKREWRIDPTLPLNRRLAARSNDVRTTAPVEPLAAAVIRLADAALAAEPAALKDPAPQTDRQRYDAAAALMAAGHVAEAAEALIALATEESAVWEVYADLAEIALKQDDQDAALELMRAAATLAPDCARAAFGASMLQAGRGDFEGGLATLGPFLRLHPNDAEALTLVRRILGAAPELSAVAWARLLTDLRHEAVTLRTTLSRHEEALQTLRNFAAAMVVPTPVSPPTVVPSHSSPPLSASHDTVPTHAATTQDAPDNPIGTPAMQIIDIDHDRQQLETARSLIAKDQLADAADILTAMVQAETQLSGAYHDLGCLAVRQGDVETAISLFSMALERDPESVTARRNLALVQGIEQQYEEALATLSPILRSGFAGNDDYGLVRDILGKVPALGPIAWARLLSDLRTPSPEQRKALDEHESLVSQLAATRAENDRLQAEVAELRAELRSLAGNPSTGARNIAWARIHALSDEDWLKVLIRSVDTPAYQGFPLPGFPAEGLQTGIVGSSNESALREGFNFYRTVKTLCADQDHPLTATTRLLDFGTGWGRYARIFMKEISPDNIVGVDVDPSLIDVCRNTFPCCSFEVVPPTPPTQLQAGGFDLVIAYSVFSHLSEAAATAWIEEFARILAPGGMIAITTQGRGFIEYCEQIRRTGEITHPWHLKLAQSFTDVAACHAAYDRGEFLYSATGGGDARPSSFYGEALVPPGFVDRVWSRYLEPVAFIDEGKLPQALIVMRKPR